MSNSLHRRVITTFEQQRDHRIFIQRQQKMALYEKLPELAALEKEQSRLGIWLTREQLVGNADALDIFRTKSAELKKEQHRLLTKEGYPADYLEPHFNCPDCHDAGYLDGKMCHCLRDRIVTATFESFDFKPDSFQENFAAFNLAFYSDIKPEGWPLSPRTNAERIKEHMENFCQQFQSTDNCYLFYGKPGLGKTFMANCIANELLNQGYSIVYATAAHLIKQVRSLIFDGREAGGLDDIYESLTHCDLLIIDDLGAEHITEFSNKQLFEIINTRLQKNRKMIISSNLSSRQIKMQYDERLSSRIIGTFKAIQFVGSDIRDLKKQH